MRLGMERGLEHHIHTVGEDIVAGDIAVGGTAVGGIVHIAVGEGGTAVGEDMWQEDTLKDSPKEGGSLTGGRQPVGGSRAPKVEGGSLLDKRASHPL